MNVLQFSEAAVHHLLPTTVLLHTKIQTILPLALTMTPVCKWKVSAYPLHYHTENM